MSKLPSAKAGRREAAKASAPGQPSDPDSQFPSSEQLLARANDQVVLMTAWVEFTSALNASLSVEDVSRAACSLLCRVFGFDQTIMVFEGLSQRVTGIRSLLGRPDAVESFGGDGAERLLVRACEECQEFVSAPANATDLAKIAGHRRVRSVLALPLRSSKERLGCLILTSLKKDFVADAPAPSILEAVGEISIAIDRVLTFERSRFEAITDPLTELYNRRYFMEAMRNEVRKAKRLGYGLGLLMIDIDDFKKVNDTYGHPAGDQVLASLARAIEASVRASDVASRYGGEEFAVILVGCAEAALFDLGEKVRVAATGVTIAAALPEAKNITVSVGAGYFNELLMTAEDLIRAADEALYAAKRSGKNRVMLGAKTVA